jgi:phage protein D
MTATSWLYELDGGATESFYVPMRRVEVGPDPGSLQAVHDVTTVTYKDAINQIDSFEFTINGGAWTPAAAHYADRLPGQPPDPDAPSLLPGAYVRVWLGYSAVEQLRPMLTGRVTQVTPSFSADSGVTLTVRALSTLEALRATPESYIWKPTTGATITDSEIAKRIVTRDGAKAVVPNKSREAGTPSVTQSNETDIAFLIKRAKARGYIVFFREIAPTPSGAGAGQPTKVIYFGPSDMLGPAELSALGERQSPYRLSWGSSLIEFRPSINLSTTLWRKVYTQFWDRRTKKNPSISCDLTELWARERGLNQDLQKLIEPVVTAEHKITDAPTHTRDEATDLVRNVLRENFLQMITAEGSTVGRPDLRAASRVEVAGIGAPFDGSWFLTNSTHTFDDNGYRTQFSARREQLTRGAS